MGEEGSLFGGWELADFPKYVFWGHIIIGIGPPSTKTFGGHMYLNP